MFQNICNNINDTHLTVLHLDKLFIFREFGFGFYKNIIGQRIA